MWNSVTGAKVARIRSMVSGNPGRFSLIVAITTRNFIDPDKYDAPIYNIGVILVIDNFDSFTYNLVQYLGQCGAELTVRRNNEITIEAIKEMNPDGIMLSPGPCTQIGRASCRERV